MRVMKNNNVHWHHATVNRSHREAINGHKSVCLWFTGLSGSGKSTIAHVTEEKLYSMGYRTYVLDGDNVRHGLCSDLGFSDNDRTENIRRIGEVAKLFVDAGMIIMTAFISPFRSDRLWVRRLLGELDFLEIYCKCPINICQRRDVKGLYRKALKGEISNFTGISSLYEEPHVPDLVIETNTVSIEQATDMVLRLLVEKGIVRER